VGAAQAGVVQASHPTVACTVYPPVIEARAIGRRNPKGEGWLIRDVSVAVHPGDRLAVLGPSRAGKTVLLRALALLDPLDAGEIHWRGHAIPGGAVPSYRKQVIYSHQRPALLDGTVEDNLRHPFTLRSHRGQQFDRERVVELLVGLDRDPAFLGKSSRDLSGGEAQLVALLRAVQLDSVVLLVDEPTASLDQATARSVEARLYRWLAAGDGERAVVWVSHDLDQARRVTDRLCTCTAVASNRRDDMGKPYLELSYTQVGLAALLILINGAISVLLKLGLERRLLLAAVCTVLQLLLIGLVLEWVFRVDRWYAVLALMLSTWT
jgi:putative ABC transport system ATP-binding protein